VTIHHVGARRVEEGEEQGEEEEEEKEEEREEETGGGGRRRGGGGGGRGGEGRGGGEGAKKGEEEDNEEEEKEEEEESEEEEEEEEEEEKEEESEKKEEEEEEEEKEEEEEAVNEKVQRAESLPASQMRFSHPTLETPLPPLPSHTVAMETPMSSLLQLTEQTRVCVPVVNKPTAAALELQLLRVGVAPLELSARSGHKGLSLKG